MCFVPIYRDKRTDSSPFKGIFKHHVVGLARPHFNINLSLLLTRYRYVVASYEVKQSHCQVLMLLCTVSKLKFIVHVSEQEHE